MAANDYHFVTRWDLADTTCEEVSDVLGDGVGLVRWWPSVYLEVKVLEPGDRRGVGKRVELFTKGWLPYTLRWSFRVVESHAPHGFTLDAVGDFVGQGIWTFEQRGPTVSAVYDWRIRAEKGVLKTFSLVLKPLFAWNHHWAMDQGCESLRLELRRRRSASADERSEVPSPPGPTFRW